MTVKGANGVPPEIIAAISASIGLVMEDASPELVAAVTAAIIHASRGGKALKIKRNSNAWSAAARQKLMDGRQFM
jgi:xanthine/CO dehydrogenase XdhC/CoxF family maturation factor